MKSFFKGVRKHIDKLDSEKLREQYELISQELNGLEQLFEAISEGIVLLSRDGEVIRSNPSARTILGNDLGETIEGLNLDLSIPSKREISIAYPEPRTATISVMPTDGGTILIIRDTTAERAAAERELESGALNAVSTLAAGLAHEIGNPLNALSMNLQVMEEDCADKETLKVCREQVQRIADFTRNFLQALRPTRPTLSPGSVADPLHNTISQLKNMLEDRRIAVTLEIPAVLPVVAFDSMQLERVFFNLIKNAMEAMRDGSALTISIGSDDREVSISFKDNGCGMSQEQLAHLFEPYRTSKKSGNGLGLMVCARIVHDHGGSISAESKLGEGTSFTVRLPRLEKRVRELK